MAADSRLAALLRALQAPDKQLDTLKLLSNAASVFSRLKNPQNVTLLASQLLSSSAIWRQNDELQTSFRFISVFQTAIVTRAQTPTDLAQSASGQYLRGPTGYSAEVSQNDFVQATLKAANSQTARWKHALLIAGIMLGLRSPEAPSGSQQLLATLGCALRKAVNISLEEMDGADSTSSHSITLALNYAFPLLSQVEQSFLHYNRLLPVLTRTAFCSQDGLSGALILQEIGSDVVPCGPNNYAWSDQSRSFQSLTKLSAQPLVAGMGPLARLIAAAVEAVNDPRLLETISQDLVTFAKTTAHLWRQNKISEVQYSEESLRFDRSTLEKTLPMLWRLMRSVLFSITIILRSLLGRVVSDGTLATTAIATDVALQSLRTLRHLYFVSVRLGSNSFSQYTFVYHTAIDILCASPSQANAFLHEIRSQSLAHIPSHAFDRTLDLYFLNTSEHLSLVLPATTSENLLCAAAAPYLSSGANRGMLDTFEAAHSVMLAVFSSTQNMELTISMLPCYIHQLFEVFPQSLSTRQFRFAFKTLLRITSPPSPLSVSSPQLAEVLLDLLHHRAMLQSSYTSPTPQSTLVGSGQTGIEGTSSSVMIAPSPEALDEQSGLTLALLDSLPFMSSHLLEEWLSLAADLIRKIDDINSRGTCRQRFWEVISNGEMDVERSQICVIWWNTKGGEERVMSDMEVRPAMSGAIGWEVEQSKL
ncbi:MAG: hypothetical protein M1828_007432 [Chrysothrix sp. TS-e1954]|nr:MAG: hypothetical protein M1828_007432 [Chrysothrix sp. TS-e1954]